MANGPYYRDEERPFLQRDDTMSLDVIRQKDVPKGRVMYVKDELNSLKTEDIHKAKPYYEHLHHLNKPDMSVGCTNPEHPGGQARSYYMPMDRRPRDLSLTTADIELAQPKTTSWKGKRHTDPVCPNYEMPSCIQRAVTPPRWNGRHTNDISDIEMTRPRVLHPDRNYERNPNDGRDIEFSTANYREMLARQSSQGPRADRTFDVRDVNLPKQKQTRCTNPLDPVYKVPTSRTTSLHARYREEASQGHEPPPVQPEEHGQVQGSKPRKLHWDNGEPHFSLLREDIEGSAPQRWVGTVPHNIYDPPEVRPMISFHDPCDIPGAQVGSLKKGIVTQRQLNPLNPRYPMLDGDQKPHSMPYLGCERQAPGVMVHPLVRSQAAASSMPNLRPNSGASASRYSQYGGQMPSPSGGLQPQQGLPRSYGNSGAATPVSHSQLPGRNSGAATPMSHSQHSPGYHMMQCGSTVRLPPDHYVDPFMHHEQPGQMSRRSSAASLRSNGRSF